MGTFGLTHKGTYSRNAGKYDQHTGTYKYLTQESRVCVSVSKMCEGCMRNAHTFKTNMQECHFKHSTSLTANKLTEIF